MLRVGFVGCGEIAGMRARSICVLNQARAEPEFEIVAACDLAPQKAADFTARWGGQSFSSVGRMLGEASLDALFIATPPSARGKAENVALALGVALWIEPPIAASIRTANALALSIRKSAVPVSVAAPHRYSPEVERVRRLLAGKTAPQMQLWQGFSGAGLSRTAWRGEARNGSVWLDGAWPMLDLLRFLGAEVVHCGARSNLEAGAAQLELRGGAVVSLGVARFGEEREHLEATGKSVSVSLRDWSSSPLVELRSGRETTIWRGEDCVQRQLEAFASLLNTGKRTENRSTIAEAVSTMKLALLLK